MKKVLYRKLLSDYLSFFIIALLSTSIIIWVFQAVNYLDIMIEDGRDYLVYINYTLLNFPKIVSKVFPFALFFSLFYVTTRSEFNNELIILWNFGIHKIKIVNFIIKLSISMLILQLFLTTFVVPKTQDKARSFLRSSNVNFFDNFVKQQKFNDTIKGVTIYADKKDKNGNLINLYLKKELDDGFQITYAKKGIIKKTNNSQILELFDGETISVIDNRTTRFKFSKSDFNFQNLETNTTTYIKTQEVRTDKLLKCYLKLEKINLLDINVDDVVLTNCLPANLSNVIKELYKRTIVPFYLPILMLILLFLTLKSKESINYLRYRILIFLFGLITLICSEMTLKFINDDLVENLRIIVIPLISVVILYSIFFTYLTIEKQKK